MGSAEFEFGVLGKSLAFFRVNKEKIKHESVEVEDNGKTVKFYVISTQEGIDRFKEKIMGLVKGTTYTKEYTDIPSLFGYSVFDRDTDTWLDVTGAVNGREDTTHPVFFTIIKSTALKIVQEIILTKN